MDPNECLREMRKLAKSVRKDGSEGEAYEDRCWPDIERLCDLVEALDGWMSSGGFPPKAWERQDLSQDGA
jgi:hypothetical protein